MSKHSKKKSISNILYRIVIIILLGIMIYSSAQIVKWYLNNKENNDVQKEISESIIVDENSENEKEKYTVDFKTLKEKNSETVAWLKVYGTNIEYIVVKGGNNSYYLTHNFNKEYNAAGWIFADYKNKFDGTDKNIIIYGHNRKNNTMFGELTNILKEEWYNNEENYKVILITENETAIYQVFSVYQVEDEDYYIQTEFKNNSTFKKFVDTIKKRSIKNFNVDVTEEDTILTLSTCANNNKYRVVLHAKKMIDNIENDDEVIVNL